ncbi:MAG: succinate dehydrogenase assembly factor 2 [Alphaproteobacteria bacterium]|nr:succinate dehydrogenase assembly factor 2 [Alphaproteobacteria bacterium]
MRSWRRGMKEMDLILGPFADTALAALSDADLDAYESLLSENDQDLYLWVTAVRDAPPEHVPILDTIRGSVTAMPR